MADLLSEINTGRRRSIADALSEPTSRPESNASHRGVPKGSDIFQEALTLAYDDMKKKKKLEKSKSEQYNSDEDFSDEERDVVRDIDSFRKFSMDFSTKRGGHRGRMNVQESGSRTRHLSEGSDGMSNTRKQQRRHSIATIPMKEPFNNNYRK